MTRNYTDNNSNRNNDLNVKHDKKLNTDNNSNRNNDLNKEDLLIILDVVVETAELPHLETQHGHDDIDCHHKRVDPP